MWIHFIPKSFKVPPGASSLAMKQNYQEIRTLSALCWYKWSSASSLNTAPVTNQFGFPAAFSNSFWSGPGRGGGNLQLQHLRQQQRSVPNATLRGQIHLLLAREGLFHACPYRHRYSPSCGEEAGRAAETLTPFQGFWGFCQAAKCLECVVFINK